MKGSRVDFGKYLMALRNRKKESDPTFSVRGLAQKMNVSATYLSKIERGEVPASDEIVYKLAEYLDVSPDEIFAQADKIDPKLGKEIAQHAAPAKMASFLRRASKLPEAQLDLINSLMDAVEKQFPKSEDGGDAKKI